MVFFPIYESKIWLQCAGIQFIASHNHHHHHHHNHTTIHILEYQTCKNGYVMLRQVALHCADHHHDKSIVPNRRSTAIRCGDSPMGPEDSDQTLNSSPSTHTRASHTSQEVKRAEGVKSPALHVATDPALHAAVVYGGNARHGVESFTGELGAMFDGPTNKDDAGKRVGEVQGEETANEADDTVEVRDGGGDEEGDDPVHRAEGVPHPAAFLGRDVGHVEDLLEDFDVDCFHADVEVEDCFDQCSFLTGGERGANRRQ